MPTILTAIFAAQFSSVVSAYLSTLHAAFMSAVNATDILPNISALVNAKLSTYFGA